MKKYIEAIAIDFGSTNSGCAGIHSFDSRGNLIYQNPEWYHHNGAYAKDNTWFFLSPEFLESIKRNYSSIKDEDFRIESRNLHDSDPNCIWGRDSVRQLYSTIQTEGWSGFRWFKMELYTGQDSFSGGLSTELKIKVFLRILKVELLRKLSVKYGKLISADDILWGLTIPSIWNDASKKLMEDIVHSVFTPQTRILSEPEGPLVSSLVHGSTIGKPEFVDGRVSLVIDCGGGTTDICLMKEDLSGVEPRIEMIARTDGSAAGGNDIDKRFYIYFIRLISNGKTSDDGVEYNSISDDEIYAMLIERFCNNNPAEFIDFEDNWFRLKSKNDWEDSNYPYCTFDVTTSYMRWLKNNGHKHIWQVVRDLQEDGFELDKNEIIEQVFNPTFKKICDKIESVICSNNTINIDRIVPSGGMSCNNLLNSRIKNTVKKILGEDAVLKVVEMSSVMAGASIMDGTCYVLLNKDIICRIANKTYYYDAKGYDSARNIKEMYQRECGVQLKYGDIENIRDAETDYILRYGDRAILLFPIVMKGHLVKNYYTDLYTDTNQENINIKFYATDDKIVIYANENNPALSTVGELKIPCKPDTKYSLEVDFNEAQISNAMHYVLKEKDTDEVVDEGFIENVIHIQ